MNLQIHSSVLLIEMFDLHGRAEIPERIAPGSLQKIITKFFEVAGHGQT